MKFFQYAVYIFSTFLILASALAIFGFEKAFREKPWPTDIESNVLIVFLSLFFIYLVKKIDTSKEKE